MDTQALGVVHEKLQENLNILRMSLDNGQPKDYAQYQNVVGQLRGIRTGMACVEDLVKNIEGADDE